MSREKKDTAIHVAYDDYAPFDTAYAERGLLRAILVTALADLNKPGDVGRKAQAYFLNRDEDYVFSFHSVCAYLNIDPQTVLVIAGLETARARPSRKEPLEKQLA